MDTPEFKYTTSFACKFSTALPNSEEWLAKASVENLKKIVPAFALENTIDLLPIAFNSCVVNLGNLNGDLIDTETALAAYKQFEHRPINIEHKRSQVVGHLIGGALSSFNINYREGFGSDLLSEADVSGKLDPFNISLSGFIYKVVDPELVDLIAEASNPLSENYLKISASWELAFNDYDILLGSPLMTKGERITDPVRKAELLPYTRALGGSGKYIDGQDVFRIIKGRVLPLGIGLTTTPAGAVQGIVTVTESAEASVEPEEIDSANVELVNDVTLNEDTSDTIAQDEQETENIISQLNTNPVNIHSIMRLQDITDENLKTLTVASLKDILSEEAQANHQKLLADAIDEASKKFGAELDEKKRLADEEASKAASTQSALDALTEEFNKIKAELDAEKAARASEKAQADYSARVADLTEKYNLSDKDRSIIAKQIAGLDDEGYAAWYADWEVIAETKSKAYQPATQQAAASVEDTLDNLNPEPSSIPNAQDLSDAKAKWASAFKLEDIISKK